MTTDAWRPQWTVTYTALLHVVAILGVAALSALFAIFVPAYARLFLRPTRSEEEVRQYAQGLFLEHGLFATRDRTAVLILISLFERRVEIVADRGFDARVAEADWHGIIASLTPHLRRQRPFDALQEGIDALYSLLRAREFRPGTAGNELPDEPIEEQGA